MCQLPLSLYEQLVNLVEGVQSLGWTEKYDSYTRLKASFLLVIFYSYPHPLTSFKC
jgi:hypothetical protein